MKIILDGVPVEGTPGELNELIELRRRSSGFAPSGKEGHESAGQEGEWTPGRADGYFSDLKKLAQQIVQKLADTSNRKLPTLALAKQLKVAPNALGPAMKNIQRIAAKKRVRPPVVKTEVGGQRVLELNEHFYKAAKEGKTV